MFTQKLPYKVALLAGDGLMSGAAAVLAYFVRFKLPWVLAVLPATKGVPPFSQYLQTIPVIVTFWTLVMAWQGCYMRMSIPALDEFIRVAKVSVIATCFLMASTFLYREAEFSRLTLMFFCVLCLSLVYIYRETVKWFKSLIARKLSPPKNILVLGNGYLANRLHTKFIRHPEYQLLKIGTKESKNVSHYLDSLQIHEVIAAEPEIPHNELVEIATLCDEKGVPFRIVPDIMELRMGEIQIDSSLGIPTFKLKPLSLQGSNYILKRTFDVLISILMISFSIIPLAFIAIAIKLFSPGAVLYSHKRKGHHGNSFDFYKFRTMVENADELLAELKNKSERNGPVFKMKNDPRITKIGKWLRKFSIDELPQLINVLAGDMSLVGPRPQVLWETAVYDHWAKRRLNVLPGITGLWQINGRAELSYEQMIDLDIYYLEHWSPGLDVKILLRTIPVILAKKGAY